MASSTSNSPRVSSEHDGDTAPARLSALYQYHNAPEVAPAHGLEYDDNVYPVSDKFPVIKESKFGHGNHYTGKHAYVNDNKPPRIIFGMKIKTFLMVATVMVLVIVGAAVGGAVGGKNLHSGSPPPAGTYGDMSGPSSSSSTTASPSPTTTTPTTYTAATPTYTPLTGCSSSMDNTTFTSQYSSKTEFSMHCNLASPLNDNFVSNVQALVSSYVYSFADCAEVCASLIAQTNVSCSFAVYKPASPRPANCWTGKASNLDAGSLGVDQGSEVAIVESS